MIGAAIRSKLLADATMVEYIVDRIWVDKAASVAAKPYIVITPEYDEYQNHLGDDIIDMVATRVLIDIIDTDPMQCDEIRLAVRKALEGSQGYVYEGVTVYGIDQLSKDQGYDEDSKEYRKTLTIEAYYQEE